MLDGDDVRTLTFGAAWAETRRYAAALRRLGLGQSTRVALAPRNTHGDVLTMLGALSLGAHVWMVSPDDPAERQQRQLAARQPDVVLGEISGASAVPSVSVDEGADITPVPVREDSAALMFNTSGSTGVPKAVVQSHSAVIANARSFTTHHRLTPERMVLGFLPIHHVNAVHSNLMATLWAGSECFLLPPDSLMRLHRWIEASHPYLVSMVPSAGDALLTSWRRPTVPSSLHHMLSAASPLSARTARDFQSRFGVRVVQGYGLSETMNFSTTVPIDLNDETYARVAIETERPSIGRAFPDAEVLVCDEVGAPLPDGVVGELRVRGPHLMTGYDDAPVATAEVMSDGWFRTGDLGYAQSEPGVGAMHYITGRLKNIAKVRGEQIGLEEIENALNSIPGVRDSVCAAEPDPRQGERIIAGVVLDAAASLTGVPERLAELIPSFALPTDISVLERVPRTPTGKILRTDSLEVLQRPSVS